MHCGQDIRRRQVGAWVRPVSARASHEVSEEERRYETGEKAQLLDVVTIPLRWQVHLGIRLKITF